MTAAKSAPVARQSARVPSAVLLPRVRSLFRLLAVLLLVVEILEWLDAGTPVWPDRNVAAVGLVAALGWTFALHRSKTPAWWLDAAGGIAIVVVGWGLGRPGAVLAMLLGATMLRVLYGSRRSSIAGTMVLLAAYVLVGVIHDGTAGILDLGVATIAVGLASFAGVIRLVGEALAGHDLAATWDDCLADGESRLLTVTDVGEVDAIAQDVLDALRQSGTPAAGGLLAVPGIPDVPDVPDVSGPGNRQSGSDEVIVPDVRSLPGHELAVRLQRMRAHITMVRQRIESEARFRDLAERSRDGIYLRDVATDGELRWVNGAAAEMIPLLPTDGQRLAVSLDLVHDDDQAGVLAELDRHGILAEPVRLRLLATMPGVEDRWVEVQEIPSSVVDGQVVAVQGTIRDVTAHHRQEAALRAALEQESEAAERLRRLDELRATFLAAVSHELRTPLAALLGAAQTLAHHRDRLDDDQSGRLASVVTRQATRLKTLLDDLLDVERLSRGLIVPERSETALLDLVNRVVEECPPSDGRVEVTGQEVVLAVDPTQIERVVDNLVRNAVRHTPPTSRVRVEVEAVAGGAQIVVEDDGIGIPPDLRERLFDAFAQGPSASRSASPGTGIGLSLVQKFVELHGGRVQIQDAPSGGARFVVFLPAVDAATDGTGQRAESVTG